MQIERLGAVTRNNSRHQIGIYDIFGTRRTSDFFDSLAAYMQVNFSKVVMVSIGDGYLLDLPL